MRGNHQNKNGNGNGACMEVALRASELSYRRLFEAARDGILILDADTGRVNDVNPFLVELLGFSRSEMVGKTVGELSPFKDIVANQAMLERLQEDAYVRYHDLPLETKDGRKIAVEFVSNVYQAGDKKVIQCNIRDITEHKRVEEALSASQLMIGEIINALPARVFWKDKNLIYLGCNMVFARDAGFAGPKDIIGKDDFQMGWRDQAEKYRGDDREIIESGCAKLLIEESQTTPDGNTITLLSSKIPLRDSKEEIIGMLGTYLDITKRKRQERELIDKSTEMERFTYTVSHDLKSPLVTIKTFLGYLEQDMAGLDKELIKQDVGYMCLAADKMGKLLDELLNLARVGRKSNPPARVTFQELAREAVGLVAGRISTSGTEVKVAEVAVVLEGDRPRLVEIWQNLVENACKFMDDQPKPRIEIGVEQRGAEMVFFVRDNGMGIDQRYQAKLFGLFEKLDPKGTGTGMGLALVKRVVELYQGRIWVESSGLGHGSSFLFTLPAAVAAASCRPVHRRTKKPVHNNHAPDSKFSRPEAGR
jgi:PAS domain S-box-containing protein